MIITIDGPAGSGKTTVAKKVAKKLNFIFCNTGAFYRMLSLVINENKIDLSCKETVFSFLKNFSFEQKEIKDKCKYFINDKDVTKEIYSKKVNEIVSHISANKFIREFLDKIQKDFAINKNVVFDGRDMGTTVFPHANLKIFLTATIETRALRRLKETKNSEFDYILQSIIDRDKKDSTRKLSPLKKPKDAILIDTTNLTISEVVEKIIKTYYEKNLL